MMTKDTEDLTSESYLLRIYRRGPGEPQDLVGTIEDVIEAHKMNFNSSQVLLDWLLQKKRGNSYVEKK